MYNAEYDTFKQTLTDLCIAVNRPYNDDLMRVFWEDLRPCPLPQIQEHAKRLRAEGKKQFTSADLRPAVRSAGTFEPRRADIDHFEAFGNIQFFKFLRLYETTPAQLPVLLERKRDVIDAARHDPEMQLGGDAEAQGAELGEILFSAWRKVIGATQLPRKDPDGFVRVGAAA
jgi:hypothetical protein